MRLSEARAAAVHLEYTVYGQSGGGGETELARGPVSIPAGFLEAELTPPRLDLGGYDFVWLTFAAGGGAEITGRDTVYCAAGIAGRSARTLIAEGSTWKYHDLSFDLELIGQPSIPFQLNLRRAGGRLVLWWLDGEATLERSETMEPGDWQSLPGGSPREDGFDARRRFYRLVK